MLQLQKSSECDTTEDDYLRIIYCKTASLFVTACRSAALSVGAPEAAMEALASYGRNLGLAFQIKDDILDYQGGEALGKPTGQDLREQKITLPLLCALASVPEEEARRIRKIVSKAFVLSISKSEKPQAFRCEATAPFAASMAYSLDLMSAAVEPSWLLQ